MHDKHAAVTMDNRHVASFRGEVPRVGEEVRTKEGLVDHRYVVRQVIWFLWGAGESEARVIVQEVEVENAGQQG